MKKFLFYLSFVGLMLTACSKDDGEEPGGKLPPLPNPNDVCSGMDDAKFIKYCYEHFDLNGDGAVSPSEAATAQIIDVDCTSLTGICYFSNLEELKGDSDSDLDFRWNTKLRKLILAGNLQKINLSQNKDLQNLELDVSNLIELDLSNNMALQWLNVHAYWNGGPSSLKKLFLPNVESLAAELFDIPVDMMLEFSATLQELYLYTDAKKVMFRSVTPPLLIGYGGDYSDFSDIIDDEGHRAIQKIYVPKEAVGTYKSAWPKFANIIEGY